MSEKADIGTCGGCDSRGGGGTAGVRVGDRKGEEFKLIDPRHLICRQREREKETSYTRSVCQSKRGRPRRGGREMERNG